MPECSSAIQGLEIGDALHRQFPVLLDEIVFNAADLRRFEYLRPIEAVVAYGESRRWGWTACTAGTCPRTCTCPRACRPLSSLTSSSPLWHGSVQVHALEMHGDKSPGIFVEIHHWVPNNSHRGHLK